MSTEKWDKDHRRLKAILQKLRSGKAMREDGGTEYIASLKRRIAALGAKLGRKER
jgi:ribosomal protein L29